jgi:hypothetical protein
MHHLLSHNHKHSVCEIYNFDASDTHIHNDSYKVEDCKICSFCIAIPEFVSFQYYLIANVTPLFASKFAANGFCFGNFKDFTYRRGPPIF